MQDLSIEYIGTWQSWQAAATIQIVDSDGAVAEGATVGATWTDTGVSAASLTCVTDANGVCVIVSQPIYSGQSALSLSIDSIGHPAAPYDARQNTAETAVNGLQPHTSGASASVTSTIEEGIVHLLWQLANAESVTRLALYRSIDGMVDSAVRLHEWTLGEMTDDASGMIDYHDAPPDQPVVLTYWLVRSENGEDIEILGTTSVMIEAGSLEQPLILVPYVSKSK